MTWYEAVILGIVQGLTEFLPISSSGHLRIVPALFGWDDPGAAFTAVTQLGTMAAVVIYYARDIWRIANTWLRSLFNPALRGNLDARMGWYVILGTIPIVILGFIFQNQIETVARDLRVIATTLIVLGIVLLIADQRGANTKTRENLNFFDAVIFGFAQALALIPGVSRSGATMTAGLFMGYDRSSAANYSFLLSIPAVVASGIFQLRDIGAGDGPGLAATAIATLLAFISGYASIAWLLGYVKNNSFFPFVVYRVILGVIVAFLLFTGVLHPTDNLTNEEISQPISTTAEDLDLAFLELNGYKSEAVVMTLGLANREKASNFEPLGGASELFAGSSWNRQRID
jgi:undecaprenyl-diphosphatase